MNVCPKPSAPAGIPATSVEVEIPDGLFFEAIDYNEANTDPSLLAETRRRVSRHRSKLKTKVALQLDDASRLSASLHAADRQGNGVPHWDAIQVLIGKLTLSVTHLGKQLAAAERRYEESQLSPGDDQ